MSNKYIIYIHIIIINRFRYKYLCNCKNIADCRVNLPIYIYIYTISKLSVS